MWPFKKEPKPEFDLTPVVPVYTHNFRVGDLVKLNSGSPLMTICAINEDTANCFYLNPKQDYGLTNYKHLPIRALIKVEKEEKKK